MVTATTTEHQQGTVLVVHNANNFYAAEGSIAVKGLTVIASENANTSVLTVFNSTPLPPPPHDVENQRFTSDLNASSRLKTSLSKTQKTRLQKTTSQTTEVEKPVAQKTTIACPFGNYPTGSNHFYALHNGVAITPSVKTSPLTPLQRRGEPTLCVEFYFLEIKKSISFYTNTQILQSKYSGQITTRPPPFIS